MKKPLIPLVLSFLLLAGVKCKKEHPPTTTTQTIIAGTVTAKINGNSFKACSKNIIYRAVESTLDELTGYYDLQANTDCYGDTFPTIYFKITDPKLVLGGDTGTYPLDISNSGTFSYYPISSGELVILKTDAFHTGTVHITENASASMSGTFQFVARNDSINKSVTISGGSFYKVPFYLIK